jgi:drug/metabolite transporter (DMT)-like permease
MERSGSFPPPKMPKSVSREMESNVRLRPAARPSRIALVLAFFAIYVIWGSTYLAIRYAVETIPPLVVAGVRHSVAGLALLTWAYTRGHRPSLREWRASLVLGTLYFAIGHGSLHWAEKVVPSGLAALLIASEPIWIAGMAAVVSHGERLTGKTVIGLLLGIASVALLLGGVTASGHRAVLIGSLAILVGTLSWSVGVFYSRSASLPRDAVARAGMPELVGAAVLLLTAGFAGEFSQLHVAAITARSAWALLYLITLGSVVAFTAYTWLLDHCSPTLVSTHTYANPIIAVLLGWLWAGEIISVRVLEAGLLTLLAVFLISRGTGESKQPEEEAVNAEVA